MNSSAMSAKYFGGSAMSLHRHHRCHRRDRRRSRAAATGAALLAVSLLVTGAAGCSGGKSKRGHGSSSKHGGSDSGATGGTVGGTTSGTTGGATGGSTAVPTQSKPSPSGGTSSGTPGTRCRTADLSAMVEVRGPGSAVLVLTNRGKGACTVHGYPAIGGQLADGTDARTGVRREPHPAEPVEFLLKSGASAYAGIKWTACSTSESSCTQVASLVLTPPDQTTRLVAGVLDQRRQSVPQLPVSSGGFTVGSFQAAERGVLFPAH
ncbi:DUF4232 domain-containing protein [Kitasatospora sp. NPDC054939]